MNIYAGLLEQEYTRVETNIDAARAILAQREERERRIADVHLEAQAARKAAHATVKQARELRQSRKRGKRRD